MNEPVKLQTCPHGRGYGDNYSHRDLVWNIEGLVARVRSLTDTVSLLTESVHSLRATIKLQDDVISLLTNMHDNDVAKALHGLIKQVADDPITDDRLERLEERINNISRDVYGPTSDDD